MKLLPLLLIVPITMGCAAGGSPEAPPVDEPNADSTGEAPDPTTPRNAQGPAVGGWARTIGSNTPTPGSTTALAVAVDASNVIHVLGTLWNPSTLVTIQEPAATRVALTGAPSHYSVYWAQLNADGSVRRAQIVSDGGNPRQIALASDGGIRICGDFTGPVDFDPGPGTFTLTSPVTGTRDGYCQALDATGHLLWASDWGNTNISVVFNEGMYLYPGSNALLLCGSFTGLADFDPGPGYQSKFPNGNIKRYDAYLLGLTPTGQFSSLKTWGGPYSDYATTVKRDTGGIYVAGHFETTTDFDPGAGVANRTTVGGADAYVLSLHQLSGAFQWVDTWGGPDYDYADDMVLSLGGSPRVVGSYKGSVDFDPGAGADVKVSNGGSDDAYLLALAAATGAYQWVDTWGGLGTEHHASIAQVAGSGDLRVSGTFDGTADFNAGSGVAMRYDTGGSDAYVLAVNNAGTYQWASTWGSRILEYTLDIAVDSYGQSLVPGYFMASTDFNPGSSTTTINPIGTSDGFIQKLTATGGW